MNFARECVSCVSSASATKTQANTLCARWGGNAEFNAHSTHKYIISRRSVWVYLALDLNTQQIERNPAYKRKTIVGTVVWCRAAVSRCRGALIDEGLLRVRFECTFCLAIVAILHTQNEILPKRDGFYIHLHTDRSAYCVHFSISGGAVDELWRSSKLWIII